MMNRLTSLHNKTQEVSEKDLPYNPTNTLITLADLRQLFDAHGLDGAQIHQLGLYQNAFVHRSYCTMKNDDFESGNEKCPADCLPLQEMSYERLEYLGDAVLGMIVAKYLYERYPDQSEGFLSKLRTKIVNGKMLGFLADKIGFPKFAIISKQIEEIQGRKNYKIMEDIFEAFIGAIVMDNNDVSTSATGQRDFDTLAQYQCLGYHFAETWIVSILETHLDFSELISTKSNYKDMLVRYMQHTFQDAPKFLEIKVFMRNNMKVFTYCVKDKAGMVLGTGEGHSKKEAENASAKSALIYYGQPIE